MESRESNWSGLNQIACRGNKSYVDTNKHYIRLAVRDILYLHSY